MQVGLILADRYEIVRPLAEGAMSTVWVARDRTTQEDVAIKAISLDAAGWRAEVRDRFMKEARLLARGKHEHLVAVRDVGETEDGFLYLVLDLLEGETLAARLARETKLDWREASTLALGIARGVGALHRQGIVHRDLKPANIVLHQTSYGIVPKIIDLGIGKAEATVGDPELCATLTATGQVLGTPQYMSFEQAQGQSGIDARSDVWALGVILYEMLAGTRPFEAPNTNAVLAAIRRNAVKRLQDVVQGVPASVVAVVDRCLNTERSARFDDADALALALEAAITEPSAAQQTIAAHPPRKFVWALAASAVVVPLVLVTVMRKDDTRAPHVDAELTANVNHASTPPLATSSLVTTEPSALPASPVTEPTQRNVLQKIPPSAQKTPAAKRKSAPVTRVDEAGF